MTKRTLDIMPTVRGSVRRHEYTMLRALASARVTSLCATEYLSTYDRVRANTRRGLAAMLVRGLAFALHDHISTNKPPATGRFALNFTVTAQHAHHVAREYHFRARMVRDGKRWHVIIGLVKMTRPMTGRAGAALPSAAALGAREHAERRLSLQLAQPQRPAAAGK